MAKTAYEAGKGDCIAQGVAGEQWKEIWLWRMTKRGSCGERMWAGWCWESGCEKMHAAAGSSFLPPGFALSTTTRKIVRAVSRPSPSRELPERLIHKGFSGIPSLLNHPVVTLSASICPWGQVTHALQQRAVSHVLQNTPEKCVLLEPVLQSPPEETVHFQAAWACWRCIYVTNVTKPERARLQAAKARGAHCTALSSLADWERQASWVLCQVLSVVCTWPWGTHSSACFLTCHLEEMALTCLLKGWFTSLSVSKNEIGGYSLLHLEEWAMATSLWAASTPILYRLPCRLCYWKVPSADLSYESPSKVSWAWSMVGASLGVAGKDAVCRSYSFFSSWINNFPLWFHSSKP